MKSKLKFLAILAFLGLFLQSCSSDDDGIDPNADSNPERFDAIEIGNANFKVPQYNVDLHTEFDYTGNTKASKMYIDIAPINVDTPNDGEIIWQLTDHLIPTDYYIGQLNPHIHYHIYFDPINEIFPEVRPAEGTYSLKITVIEEDGSESIITKEFEVIKKFFEVEIGDAGKVAFGSDEIHTEFEYDAGDNTVTEIRYQLWFEEWREGQNVAVGDWDNIIVTLPTTDYLGLKNPHIHYHLDLDANYPIGDYWLNIYVEESTGEEAVKLSVPVSIVEVEE